MKIQIAIMRISLNYLKEEALLALPSQTLQKSIIFQSPVKNAVQVHIHKYTHNNSYYDGQGVRPHLKCFGSISQVQLSAMVTILCIHAAKNVTVDDL